MRNLKLIIFCAVLKISFAQKCTSIVDSRNVTQTVKCTNVMSMNDIADEIKSNWASLRIVNKAAHPYFSNIAGIL